MKQPADIIAINKHMRLAIDAHDKQYPFASIHDADGDEVEDVEDADFAVIEPHPGWWQPIIFADFEDHKN